MNEFLLMGLILVIGILVYRQFKSKRSAGPTFQIATTSMDDERVESVGLKFKPENGTPVLDKSSLHLAWKEKQENPGYRGNEAIECLIDIKTPKGFQYDKDRFLEVFDYEWRVHHSCTFYAFFPTTNSWSYAISAGSPQIFHSLEMAIPLAERYGEDQEWSQAELQRYLRDLEAKMRMFETPFEIIPRKTAEDALDLSKSLKDIQRTIYADVIIVLEGNSGFESHTFWNTLVDLGLSWGNGDLFHWMNENEFVGGDELFSVWTNTKPEYFLPEDVAKGHLKPKDLVFGFSLPRSPDPLGVFESMVKAVEYCLEKMGGQILNEDGEPFVPSVYRKKIEDSLNKMNELGWEHGTGVTKMLF